MQDEILQEYLCHPTEQWLLNTFRLLFKDEKIYMPLADNLCTYMLQYHHNYILAGHFGQNKILELICCGYT